GHCVLGEVVGKELQGDVAAELQVFRLVHNTHPAAAELLDDAVVRDGLADHAEEACFSGPSHLRDATSVSQRMIRSSPSVANMEHALCRVMEVARWLPVGRPFGSGLRPAPVAPSGSLSTSRSRNSHV